jgi:hypothetical protein
MIGWLQLVVALFCLSVPRLGGLLARPNVGGHDSIGNGH